MRLRILCGAPKPHFAKPPSALPGSGWPGDAVAAVLSPSLVAIRLDKGDLERELDRALRDALGKGPTPPLWIQRVEWLGQFAEDAAGKTYVAALGAALLAKATDQRVDSLTQSAKAGPTGYSLRSVAEFLQEKVRGRVHLGTLSKWPLNNSPFLRGPHRIDHFTAVSGHTRQAYDEFVRWLDELNGYDAAKAHAALVAFLRVRAELQRRESAAAKATARIGPARSLEELVAALQVFVAEDPEGGGRGQAIVAAVLDCAYPDVEVIPKNHPAPFDVRRKGKPPPLACEVKQQTVSVGDVLELARRAAAAEAPHAIYASLHPEQPALPVDRLRADALQAHGVLIDVCSDVRELVVRVGVYGSVDAAQLGASLPARAIARCRETGVSTAGQRRLVALLRGVTDALVSAA